MRRSSWASVGQLDDAVDEDAESAWSKEIARRIDEIDRGQVKTVPWSVAPADPLPRAGPERATALAVEVIYG
jgi:hypothetical protein